MEENITRKALQQARACAVVACMYIKARQEMNPVKWSVLMIKNLGIVLMVWLLFCQ